MASWLIVTIAFVYLVIAVQFFLTNQLGLGITFIGFCLGNFGLYLQSLNAT